MSSVLKPAFAVSWVGDLVSLFRRGATPAAIETPRETPKGAVTASAPADSYVSAQPSLFEAKSVAPVSTTLRQGDRGDGVRWVQERLAIHGFSPGPADSIFGARTDRAVRDFQTAEGLTADGLVGPRTRAALLTTPSPNADLSLSDSGVELIAGFEGFSGTLYDDPAGHCTIGFGHLVHLGPCDGRASEAPYENGITRSEASALPREDASVAEDAVRRLIEVPLNQNQFDALVSFTFNLGGGALEGSTLRARLNRGEYDAVPLELDKWVKAGGAVLPGLVRRRAREGEVWSHGYQTPERLHRIEPGETLGGIARLYGVTVEALVVANDIADPNRIRAGRELIIPRGE